MRRFSFSLELEDFLNFFLCFGLNWMGSCCFCCSGGDSTSLLDEISSLTSWLDKWLDEDMFNKFVCECFRVPVSLVLNLAGEDTEC